jgi:hypothetical protein
MSHREAQVPKKSSTKNVWRDKARATERERGKTFEQFLTAVSALGEGMVSSIGDDLGGTLYCFYRPASPGDYVPIEHDYSVTARSTKTAAERSPILATELPQLKAKFREGIPAVLEHALRDHLLRCVGALRAAIIGAEGRSEISSYDGTQEFGPGVRLKPSKKARYDYTADGRVSRREMGMKGRRAGTKKPERIRQQERDAVTCQIQQAFETLLSSTGKKPTKTAVARRVGFGGVNPATGTDSSLNALNNKLKRLGLDYKTIIEAVKLNR